MGKKTGDIRRAEKLIQKKERQTKKANRPACCGSCEYNQPNFKYRTCLFVRCPMDKTRKILRNMRQYLLASLYNAPMTMHSSYAARVQHDLNAK